METRIELGKRDLYITQLNRVNLDWAEFSRFVSFPEHLVRLLELCVSCASDSSPKYEPPCTSAKKIVTVRCRYVSRLTLRPSESRGVLSVLETSRLRHLQHLELEFRAASDLDLKDYLSHQVKMYKVRLASFCVVTVGQSLRHAMLYPTGTHPRTTQ